MTPRTTIILTQGTSILANINRQRESMAPELIRAMDEKRWNAAGRMLASAYVAEDRLLGAEVNSLAAMVRRGYASPHARLALLHSDTEEGDSVSQLLGGVLDAQGFAQVVHHRIEALAARDPENFRRIGLRNLVRAIGRELQSYGTEACAINATGGYKAQIAVATLIGQALHVPVYYKHEQFDDVIEVSPMPVALDDRIWHEHRDLFFILEREASGVVEASRFGHQLPPLLDSLIETVCIDGADHLCLTPTGQIFHQHFVLRHQDKASRARLEALRVTDEERRTRPAVVENAGSFPRRAIAFIEKVAATPYALSARSSYHNPDLNRATAFYVRPIKGSDQNGIEGEWSESGATVKFTVETKAGGRREDLDLVCTALNLWLSGEAP